MIFRIGEEDDGRAVKIEKTPHHIYLFSRAEVGPNWRVIVELSRSEALALAGAMRAMAEALEE